MNILNKCIFIVILSAFSMQSYAQDDTQTIQGTVSFLTSKNVYVNFDDTDRISIGDTLAISKGQPCLLVTNKSSRSVVCTRLNDCEVSKGDAISFSYKVVSRAEVIEDEAVVESIGINYNDSIQAVKVKPEFHFYTEDIRGRLSAASYSTFASLRDDTHRLLSRFSLNANHINNSKFSVETYLNYRKNISEGTRSSVNDNALRVFNLALRYDLDSTLSITLGRKINYKISSVGAIDGLQVEKFFGKTYVGVIGGFRPDILDFGFNSNLVQYGAYIGRLTDSKNFRSQTTLGVAEQRNQGELDRRFAYFQHSSTIAKRLNLYATTELELFNTINDSVNADFRLTNLYLTARYRFNKKVNLALSFDSRKRIIYYKTYETDIEQLLDEDIARQGVRARLNLRPFKNTFAGLSYSRRFQSDNQNKSENMYGYISYSRLPIVGGRLSLTYNRNASNYLDTNIAAIRYATSFLDDRLSANFYYRLVDYNYASAVVPDFFQHYAGTYLSYYIDRSLVISVAGEFTTYNDENNFRLNTRIIKRLFRQRKK